MAASDTVKASAKSVFERDSFFKKVIAAKRVEQYNPFLKSTCTNR